MGAVLQHLKGLIGDQVDRHRIVVWYEPEEGSLRSARGVLRMRVPAGVGAGEHPVSLLSEGEESQPAAISVSP